MSASGFRGRRVDAMRAGIRIRIVMDRGAQTLAGKVAKGLTGNSSYMCCNQRAKDLVSGQISPASTARGHGVCARGVQLPAWRSVEGACGRRWTLLNLTK